jgi:hypothetical protein
MQPRAEDAFEAVSCIREFMRMRDKEYLQELFDNRNQLFDNYELLEYEGFRISSGRVVFDPVQKPWWNRSSFRSRFKFENWCGGRTLTRRFRAVTEG